MEVKPGYRQAEAGVVPEDWRLSSMGDEADLLTGFPFPSSGFTKSGARLLRGSNVKRGAVDWSTEITQHWPAVEVKTQAYELRKGDLVIAMDGALVGRSFATIAASDLPALLVQRVARLRSKKSVQGLLRAWVASDFFVRHVDLVKTHTAIPHISPKDIRQFALVVPNATAEQRAIADALSDADALLAGLDRLIAKKRDLKQAAMQQLLTGLTRLPGFQGKWEVKTVAALEKQKLLKLSRGQVISKRGIDSRPGDFPIYSSSIHNDGLFGCYGDFMFDEELITWSVDGGGNFFHRPKHKFSVTNVCGFMRVDTAHIDYRFFAAQLQLLHSRKSFDYQSKAHPSVVRKEYEVQLPSLPEQRALATVLSDVDAELTALEARRNKTRALKQGMMQELLTGRTRLI